MLLYQRHEMLEKRRISNHHCLTEQCTDLGTTDIKHVRQTCYIPKSHVITLCSKAESQSSSVYEKRNTSIMAHCTYIFEFLQRIHGSVLCRE